MFGHRYFAARQFAPRYYPPKIAGVAPTPTGITSFGYFPHKYFAGREFANRYYPGAGFGTQSPTPTPTPTPSLEYLGGGAWHYHTPYSRLKKKQEELSERIDALEEKIETKTLARQPDAHASLREEINFLLEERAALIRRIDDEEAVTVLLLTPFL